MQVLADRSESLLGSQVHTNSKGAPMGYEQNTEQASLSNYTRLSEKCFFFFFGWPPRGLCRGTAGWPPMLIFFK